jgi:hypothetical protein
LHDHYITLSTVSSKIQYKNDSYADWLEEAHHLAHIEVSGPIFGGVTKGCFCCFDAMTNGSLTPYGNHSNECPWKHFIFLVLLLLMEQ